MDVPFHSSGAISRAHYALVRKVETAQSVQVADQHIYLEIKSLKERFLNPKLRLEECKESLVVLLFCAMSVSHGFLPANTFDFAFLQAINLAELGMKIEDKRIGYLFCSELMPVEEELRLMLVNTLRKDLESTHVPQICVALDNLIASPTEDVLPVVQSRLQDLLHHELPHVKRRALLAIRALSLHNTTLIERLQPSISRYLKDQDESVMKAALFLLKNHPPLEEPKVSRCKTQARRLLAKECTRIDGASIGVITHVLRLLQVVGFDDADVPMLLNTLSSVSVEKGQGRMAATLELFKTFRLVNAETLIADQDAKRMSIVKVIREYLQSSYPNDNYLFLSCLELVDVSDWAGTGSLRPAVLEGGDFERIMQLMSSPDHAILRKTLSLIYAVDPEILRAQLSVITQTCFVDLETAERSMPVILTSLSVLHPQDGEKYAADIVDIVQQAEKNFTRPHIFKHIVTTVLTEIRESHGLVFLTSCASYLIQLLVKSAAPLGPTLLVVITALATELSVTVSQPPIEILTALTTQLKVCPSIVQEPCLIAMLRVAADCDNIPTDILAAVQAVGLKSRPHIKTWCARFSEFSSNKVALREIIRQAATPSLPDFLAAFMQYLVDASSAHEVSQPAELAEKVSKQYDMNPRNRSENRPKFRARSARQSSTSRSSSSARIDGASDVSVPIRLSSPVITAGQLTLAEGSDDGMLWHGQPFNPSPGNSELIDLQASRLDLISLESPFQGDPLLIADLTHSGGDIGDFENIWKSFTGSCDLRGWCKASMTTILRRLQMVNQYTLKVIDADMPPFEGELKVIMFSNPQPHNKDLSVVALRLHEEDDESCLWRLRCGDADVGASIQAIIGD